jgi:hypothetical protein
MKGKKGAVYLLIDSSDVVGIRVFLGVHLLAHCRLWKQKIWLSLKIIDFSKFTITTNNVQSGQSDIGKYVERFISHFSFHSFGQHGALFVEDVDKVLQDFKMECRSENLSSGMPFPPLTS